MDDAALRPLLTQHLRNGKKKMNPQDLVLPEHPLTMISLQLSRKCIFNEQAAYVLHSLLLSSYSATDNSGYFKLHQVEVHSA